jgi:hypothetical protein
VHGRAVCGVPRPGTTPRLTTLRELASVLAAKQGFDSRLSVERAADILYAAVSDELYRILVIQRHWPVRDWREWAYDGAAFRMFPQPLVGSADNRRSP